MKKTLAFLLTVFLTAAAAVPAFASETGSVTEDGGQGSGAVTGNYESGAQGGTVVCVDISWNNLNFTYHDASEPVWDPAACTYSEAIEAGWYDSNASITVTNRSNTAVSVTPVYAQAEGFESANMALGTDVLTLDSADADPAGPREGSISVTPTGTLPEGTQNAVIGHITVTVTAVGPSE